MFGLFYVLYVGEKIKQAVNSKQTSNYRHVMTNKELIKDGIVRLIFIILIMLSCYFITRKKEKPKPLPYTHERHMEYIENQGKHNHH